MCDKKDGFEYYFDRQNCATCGGKCCTGESGYIWINDDEISKIAAKFEILKEQFMALYLEKVGIRYSIKEKIYNGGYACCFFDEENKNCGIYEFRPNQCKTFPFWDYYKKHFSELEEECAGVRRF